jgi:hypothetical protein
MSSTRWIRGGVLCAALVVLAGCGSDNTAQQKPVHPVRGQVFFGGKAAAGAFVEFVPVQESPNSADPRPRGTVNDDGSFTLSTYGVNDGAPAGDYVVIVTWPVGDNDEDRLRGRYVDRTKSTLKATVQEGNNELTAYNLK